MNHEVGRSLRMGVLGCADIAIRRLLPAFAQLDSAKLVAVASRNRDKARHVAERFGCTPVAGYDRLLARDDIDAVYIPLPSGLHHEWVVAALRAGKHVLVEKPLCTEYAQAVELVELAHESDLALVENFMFLHHSQHGTVRSLVEDGEVGALRVFSSSYGVPPLAPTSFRYRPDLGGGALLDVGVYPIRAAMLFLGDDLDVLGASLTVDEVTGVDVAGSVLLGAPHGVTAQLDFGFQHFYRSSYQLWGSRGRLSALRAFTPPEQHRPLVRVEHQDRVSELSLPADHQVRNALASFASLVQARRERSVPQSAGGLPVRRDEPTEIGRALLRQADLVEQVRKAARQVTV